MGIFSEFQSMTNLFQEAGKMELYKKISELFEENKALKEEVSKLKEKLRLKGSMEFENRAYWIKNKERNVKDGPFCPHCWETESLQMRLIESTINPIIKRCSKCKYFTKD